MPGPLAGLTVVECGVAVAGPLATRYLGHLGADVIKIDSRATNGFSSPPRWAPAGIGAAGLDLGVGNTLNAEKMSLALDLKPAAGREAFARLIERTDIFVTNLSVPGIESLGITYESLKDWNPSLIYIALTGFGSGSGPYRDYRSWGPNLSGLSGLDYLTGDPDRSPVMHPSPYPDHVSAYHAVVAILAALLRRDLTKEGQQIEMGQFETVINLLGPQVLEAQLAGKAPIREGNRHASVSPRVLLPCRGRDNWLALEVSSDAEWQALCAVGGIPSALQDPAYRSHAGRLQHQDAIEAILAEWSAPFTNRELALLLQRAGVAANPVQRPWEHLTDPQLDARGFWRIVGHDRLGTDITSTLPMRFSTTPAQYTISSPSFGHHTVEVLTERAGLPMATVEELIATGVAEAEAPIPDSVDWSLLERPSKRWAWPLLRVLDHGDDPWISPPEGTAVPGKPVDLTACRVLDLSDPTSAYGSRLLAMFGADVLRVDQPGGGPVATFAPVIEGESLFARYMDAGKRRVELDLSTPEGRAQFEALVADADLVYESTGPGHLASLGLGWDRLRALNPRLSLVSITPFGQNGPYRDWKMGELGFWARAGGLPLTGYPDRRPVAPGGGLALGFVGTTGAIAALSALRARNTTGAGQWVDVSAHEVMVFTASRMLAQIDEIVDRTRNGVRALGSGPYGYYTCNDRLICLLALMPQHWASLSEWIAEVTGDQNALDPRFQGSGASRYTYIDDVDALVNSLARLMGADEFCKEAQRRGIPAMPVNSMTDLLADPHLAAVDFWRVSDSDPSLRWPGPPFRMANLRVPTP